ncbi:uncharacterized protein V6R79_020424 [Siganus canaliculatus]
MKATPRPLLLLLLFSAGWVRGHLQPRSLLQLVETIQCVQPGTGAFKYTDYGCWCGTRASGPALDDVDLCCKIHDTCWSDVVSAGCSSFLDLPLMAVYGYTCSDQQVTCSASNSRCQAAACECDRAAAECFAKTTYNEGLKGLDPDEFCTQKYVGLFRLD